MNKKIFKSVLLASVLLSVISTPVKSADFTPSNQTYDIYGYQNANSLTVSGTVENNTTTNTSNPQAYSFGGAIYNTGTLNVSENTIFQKNYLNGSTTDNEYYQGSAGGAIANYGNLTIGNNVQFIQNGFKNSGAISEAINDAAGLSAAAGAIDGGAIFSNSLGAVITIGNGVKFQNNIAAGYGGAIYSIDGKVTIGENATFENNISHYGGAITNDQTNGTASLTIGNGASFTGNKAINDNGGAIANWYGTTTIGENAKFTDNSSGYAGGALFNSDSATMSVAKNAAFSGNSSKADADGGGAISNRGNLTVNGGTTFSKNSAAVSGGAVYNKGKIIFDTTDGNITFSENTAKRGSDLFLNDNSTVEITGTSADNKISFGSQKSIAGSGNIVNKSNGIVEIINNKDLSDFTGIYTQENGTLSLDNSTIFNSYDIKSGELQILNGSVAEINGTTKKLADGTVLKVAGADSLLTLKGATIGENTQVNLQGGGKIDITGGSSLSLYQSPVSFFSVKDDGDTWEGDIHVSNDGDNSLTLNNFTHDTSNGGGNLTVDGGSVNLEGSSNLTLGNTESSISDGNINVDGDSNLTVKGGSSVSGGTFDVKGDLNIGENGTVSGGTFNVEKGGKMDVQSNATVSEGDITVNGDGELSVEGNMTGGSITAKGAEGSETGGKVTVSGTIAEAVDTEIQKGSELDIKEHGSVTLDSTDTWEGNIKNENGSLTLDGITHSSSSGTYTQSGGSLNLQNGSQLELGTGSSISDGNITVSGDNSGITVTDGGSISGGETTLSEGGNLTVDGGTMTGGTVKVDEGSDFNFKSGTVSGGKLEFEGEAKVNIGGTVQETANFDVTEGTVNIVGGGDVTLDGEETSGDQWTDGTVHLDGGKLTFTGTANKANGAFTGDKGELNIQGDEQDFTLKSGSYIKDAVKTTIDDGSTLDIQGGEVTLSNGESPDTWNGNIEISDGSLTLNNVAKGANASIKQTGGSQTVTGNFNLNNSNDSITGGSLKIGDGENSGTITQSAGEIGKDAEVNITGKGTLDVQGGKTTLNGGEKPDTWDGNVKVSGSGELTLSGITKNGKLTADGGTVTLSESSNLTVYGDSSITDNTKLNIDDKTTLTVKNNSGDNSGVTFGGEGDSWKGTVDLQEGGKLTYTGSNGNSGTLLASGGNLTTAEGSNLSVNANSFIKDAVNANVQGQLTITGSGEDARGVVDLNSGDSVLGNITINNNGVLNLGDGVTLAEEGQEINFSGDNANMNLVGESGNLDLKAALKGSNGNINKNGSGNVNFVGDTSSYKGNLTVNNSGKLEFYGESGFGGNLLFGDIVGKEITIASDKIQGSTELAQEATINFETHSENANLEFDNAVKVSDGGTINARGKSGNVSFKNSVTANGGTVGAYGNEVTFGNDVSVSNKGKVNAYGNSVEFSSGFKADDSTVNVASSTQANLGAVDLTNSTVNVLGGFTASSVTYNGMNVTNAIDGVITENNLGEVTFNADGNAVGGAGIDISPRDWNSDTFLTGTVTNNGTFNVSDFQFNGLPPIDRHIPLQVFRNSDGTPYEDYLFTATDKEVFTPIGWYGINSHGDGLYTASLRRYNPQVFRGQVATVSMYQNQLVVNNTLFNHTQEAYLQYLTQKGSNKYAAAFPQFAPYQYNRKDGSLWFKGFGTFETLNMNQGLNVQNNFYGGLVGADFGAVELGNGWELLPTAYVGYMGAHQTYANTSMFQNGGQAGAMATFFKNDFIGSLLVYGGGYGNEMTVAGHNDEAGNWFAGSAAKFAYNLHPSKHFIIQPTALVSYNIFGEQKWYTGYGVMDMQSAFLNGINVAPGLNLIYGRETWNIYATIQYFYNILGYAGGRAGHVDLPSIGMRHGFLEYGFGVQKTWKDRFSGYLQFVIRNGGRTGVGVQGGLLYKL